MTQNVQFNTVISIKDLKVRLVNLKCIELNKY